MFKFIIMKSFILQIHSMLICYIIQYHIEREVRKEVVEIEILYAKLCIYTHNEVRLFDIKNFHEIWICKIITCFKLFLITLVRNIYKFCPKNYRFIYITPNRYEDTFVLIHSILKLLS